MSFWSGAKLRERLPALIVPYRPERIDCAAYTLSIGEQVYVSPTEDVTDPKSKTIQQLGPTQPFIIPPGQFAFLLTDESVEVPADVLGFISIRSKLKFRGLVNVSGFHVDPGYRGRLLFAVHNAGPSTIHLRRGDPCFLIWFTDLDRASNDTRKVPGLVAIDTEFVSNLAQEFKTLAGLSDHIEEVKADLDRRVYAVESEQRVVRAILTVAVALVLGFVGSHWVGSSGSSIGGQQPASTSTPASAPTATPSPRRP